MPSAKRAYKPVPVSTNIYGRPKRKTFAFIPHGGKEDRVLSKVDQRINALRRRSPRDVKKSAIDRSNRVRALIANNSTEFLKVISAREERMRARVKSLGIRIDEPIVDLEPSKKTKKRTKEWLFRRNENWPISFFLKKNSSSKRFRQHVAEKILGILFVLHRNGITHGHPHLRNFLVNQRGEVTAIDFSMAKQWKNPPQNKNEFLERFAMEIFYPANYCADIINPHDKRLGKRLAKRTLQTYARSMNTFGTTYSDILHYLWDGSLN